MATLGIQVNPVAVSRIKSLLMDPAYKESIEQSSSYNTRLCQERRLRLPFLDAQTGVAQSNCYLWMTKRQRMPGQNPGQLYTYPSKRWRKKRRQYLINFLRPTRTRDIELNESDVHQICSVENSSTKLDSDDREEKATEDSKDSWYKDYEDASEPPDAGEIDEPESDFDDYEETYTKRRKKKAVTKTKKKEKAEPLTDAEKPYVCEACGARYKTRPGLTYHYTHSHNGLTESTDDENTVPSPPKPPASTTDPLAGPKSGKSQATPSPYCDFCLGDANENKKTKQPEELVSCSDCGRSGHPSCLQFTPNMMISVKKYRWQCIECKCCTICGTSDNDDQLLFCDDCDRGYHMYCLNPPLSEPPEGSWSCHLCIEEFHKK